MLIGIGDELLGAEVEIAPGDAEVVLTFRGPSAEPARADAGLLELAQHFDGEPDGGRKADEIGLVERAECDA